MVRTAGRALAVLALLISGSVASSAEDVAAREAMVKTIQAHTKYTDGIFGAEGLSPEVLAVMREIERHRFVPPDRESLAYADRPVKIGYGQTISQPFIVALMTHLLAPKRGDVVLEIGTGSGYQAAVLSPLVAKVCTIEIISGLGRRAAALLKDLGYDNVETKIADGYHGWPECGPFDGIIVTAAADHVPPPLVAQLKPGGRMVIPVGHAFATQHLILVEKTADGKISSRQLLPVRFVPFRRAGN